MAGAVPQARMIIVLDTQAFDAALFQLESGTLHGLQDEARKRKASIALTDVQVHEVRAHLKRDVEEVKKVARALSAHAGKRSIRKDKSDAADVGTPLPRMLQHTRIRNALDGVAQAADEVAAALERFLGGSMVITIPCGEVKASRLLPNYFGGNAPFGPGRKKDEFPDAIAIEALKDFADASTGAQIIVISGDSDWYRALKENTSFQFFPDAREALQHLRDLDSLAEAIQQSQLGESHLSEKVADHFGELDFSLEEDWGADVEDAEVSTSTITRIDVTSLHNRIATIEFEAEVHFTCQAQWPDDDYTHWQQNYQVAHIDARTTVAGTADLTLSDDNSEVDEIDAFSITGPIRVSLDDATKIVPKRWDYERGEAG